MRDAAIDRLDETAHSLRGAMDGGDAKQIEAALDAFAAALETVRGVAAWDADPALKARLQDLRARMVGDQKFARLVGDKAQQRLDILGDMTAEPVGRATYTRKG